MFLVYFFHVRVGGHKNSIFSHAVSHDLSSRDCVEIDFLKLSLGWRVWRATKSLGKKCGAGTSGGSAGVWKFIAQLPKLPQSGNFVKPGQPRREHYAF